MPQVEKTFTIKVSPNQFLKACSIKELKEIEILLQMPEYQEKLKYYKPARKTVKPNDNSLQHTACENTNRLKAYLQRR